MQKYQKLNEILRLEKSQNLDFALTQLTKNYLTRSISEVETDQNLDQQIKSYMNFSKVLSKD